MLAGFFVARRVEAMEEFFDPQWGSATLGVRAAEPRSESREHSAALSLTSSYVSGSAAQAAAVFSGAEPGYIYSRFTNPTTEAFEKRLAARESGAQIGRASCRDRGWQYV